LRKILEDNVELMAKQPERGGKIWKYVKDKAEFFEGCRPSWEVPLLWAFKVVRRARFGACYYNSQLVSIVFPEMAYYEGVAERGDGYAVGHAWNVRNGVVFDITWEKLPLLFREDLEILRKYQYLGVEIPRWFLLKASPFRKGYAEFLLPLYLEEIGVI